MIKWFILGALGVAAVGVAYVALGSRRAVATVPPTNPLRLPGLAPKDPVPFEEKDAAQWVSGYLAPTDNPVDRVPIRSEPRADSTSTAFINPYYGFGQRMPGDIA